MSATSLSNAAPLATTVRAHPRPAAARGPATLDIDFVPADRSVHHVRVLSHSLVLLHGHDHTTAARVTVACTELIDQVAWRHFERGCQLRLWLDPSSSRIRIELAGDTSAEKARFLEEKTALVNQGGAAEAYTRALARAGMGEEGVLGLARIRYEGQLRLECVRRGNKVLIAAEGTLG